MFGETPATRVGRVTPSGFSHQLLLHPHSSSCLARSTHFLVSSADDMETIDISRLKSGEVNLGVRSDISAQ